MAYGVTTTPHRRDTLLPKTLASLAAAGFPRPRLFVDGCNDPAQYAGLGCEVTLRSPEVRTLANTILGLAELYARHPLAERYAMFQDDIIVSRGLRQFMDSAKLPGKGYFNLFTAPENERLSHGRTGWFASDQWGRGALGLVFDREALMELLSCGRIVRWIYSRSKARDPQKPAWKSVDGAIVTALGERGYPEFCHYPSLIQHVGRQTSMGNRRREQSRSFRGEDFDLNHMLR